MWLNGKTHFDEHLQGKKHRKNERKMRKDEKSDKKGRSNEKNVEKAERKQEKAKKTIEEGKPVKEGAITARRDKAWTGQEPRQTRNEAARRGEKTKAAAK